MPRASNHHQPHRLVIENPDGGEEPRSFVDQDLSGRVLLDGATFERCRFNGADLIYIGGEPPKIVGCSFRDVSFQFKGGAARTVAFLQGMSAPSSGLSSVFKATFPRLFGH